MQYVPIEVQNPVLNIGVFLLAPAGKPSRLQQVALQVDRPAVMTALYRLSVRMRAAGGVLPEATLTGQLEDMGYSKDVVWWVAVPPLAACRKLAAIMLPATAVLPLLRQIC
jgi:hypothetical protein